MPSNYIGDRAPVNIGRFDVKTTLTKAYEISSGMVALFSFGSIHHNTEVDTCAPEVSLRRRKLLSHGYFPGGVAAA